MGVEVEILRRHHARAEVHRSYLSLRMRQENQELLPPPIINSVSNYKQQKFTTLGSTRLWNDTVKQDLLKAESGARKQTVWLPDPTLSMR